jgi:hypothetical protein
MLPLCLFWRHTYWFFSGLSKFSGAREMRFPHVVQDMLWVSGFQPRSHLELKYLRPCAVWSPYYWQFPVHTPFPSCNSSSSEFNQIFMFIGEATDGRTPVPSHPGGKQEPESTCVPSWIPATKLSASLNITFVMSTVLLRGTNFFARKLILLCIYSSLFHCRIAYRLRFCSKELFFCLKITFVALPFADLPWAVTWVVFGTTVFLFLCYPTSFEHVPAPPYFQHTSFNGIFKLM